MLLNDNRVNDNSKTYAKQIHPYNGKVYAEIIYQSKETDYDWQSKLWYVSMYKSFGSSWNSAPREKDYINAHEWCDEQLRLLSEYGVVKIQQAQFIGELK